MYGSGDVPQDELGPPCEFEDAGELCDVLCPLLLFAAVESVLDLGVDFCGCGWPSTLLCWPKMLENESHDSKVGMLRFASKLKELCDRGL